MKESIVNPEAVEALSNHIATFGDCTLLGSADKPTSDSDTKTANLSQSINGFRYIMIMSAYDNTGDLEYGHIILPVIYAKKHQSEGGSPLYCNTVNGGVLRCWFESNGSVFKVNTRSEWQRNEPLGQKVVVVGIK